MATMTGDVTNFNYGSCQVTFNAVDLGFFKDAVVFRYEVTYYDVRSIQSSMNLDKKVITESAIAVIAMQETDLDVLQAVCPTGTYVLDGSGSKKKIQFGGNQLSSSDAKQLIITPTTDGIGTLTTDNNEKVTIYKCFAHVMIEHSFSLENGELVTPVEFHAIADTTKATGNQLCLLGDSTASA